MSDTVFKSRQAEGLWRATWRRFRAYRLGMAGLTVILALFCVAFFSPLLANRQPIFCKYDGALYFPGVVETLQNVPFASYVLEKDKPFRLPLAARIISALPILRNLPARLIGWGIRPERVHLMP